MTFSCSYITCLLAVSIGSSDEGTASEATSDLFVLGQTLIAEDTDNVVGWFAAGAYYYASNDYDQAKRFLRAFVTVDFS